ncbi:uncharacterized protein TOT_040000488 [Theileria orientalis strain Shintoku]|uniref:Uncharacterized protein n=1 Tax=Theileria orientalis strain Shintoku TaxID=869250 RepID=J4DAP6_THEOR|nr:uncharacterized protein TOT_040000488 [Theileria orientalis strain Shintoku]BAM42115.1 uncharacterized protein TOT_040000488 [Theileria orientalis strain Shintoku]|eukprot:XP_009692416.1 uncharacterized protein TOT_040000488 [Theileria orientalis strain Shintoku]
MLLFLIILKEGAQDPSPVKVDLSLDSSKDFTKTYMEFDNASYIVYKGKDDWDIDEVTHGNEVVWTYSHEYGKAKAVIMTYENGSPRLLFVYTPRHAHYKFYYVRVDGKWVRTTYYWYSHRLGLLKTKINHEFRMDIGFLKMTNTFIHYPKTRTKPYDTFLPFNGHAAKSVEYNGIALWTANSDDERAVAVWAYKIRSLHYLVRVLVYDEDKNYTFHDFVKISGAWVDMARTPLGMRPGHRYPDDIMFPEYLLMKANRQIMTGEAPRSADPRDLDATLAMSYDYEYHYRPIPPYLCHKFDFSKDSRSQVVTRDSSVFGKDLKLESYFPQAGHFFGVVTEGPDTIYHRNVDIEASIGVHFYTKDGEPYLADVLVFSPKRPRSEYHVKVNGKWSPVNSGRFFTLLEELRKHQRPKSQTKLSGS